MADIVGVVFRGGVKIYHFDPAGLELERGDQVVVQTSSGPEIGRVVEPPRTIEDSELPAPLKKVVRVATGKDLESQAESEGLRRQAMDACRELIKQHGLDMKLVGADIGFGAEKITFMFFSEERVDFRGLVADLAKTLKMRIELRQVGAREEARMVGGLGPCGRALCCTLFAGDDEPVSIRMAKEQNLPLNPMKISGLCGRLMCCLKYEQEQYVRFRKEAPPKGTPVSTPAGQAVVCGYNVTKDAIVVRFEDGSNTEVKLSTCQEQEDGGLLVVPEVPVVEPPLAISWLDSPMGIERLEDAEEALPVVEAEVVLNENGEPVKVVVAESSRQGRSRRGRGRRKSKSREQSDGEAGAAAAGPGQAKAGKSGSAGEGRSSGRPGSPRGEESGGSEGGSHRKPAHPRGQRSDRRAKDGRTPEGESGRKTGPAEDGGEQTGTGAVSKSRRRRRPRRSSGGSGDRSGGDGGSNAGKGSGTGGGGDSGAA